MTLPSFRALRILSAVRRGSSLPVVVDTEAGRFLLKLRGAAQGLPPLIAEVIVAELATALGLPVPERAWIALDGDVPSEDRNDELADTLAASHGMNLGFRWLDGATDLREDRLGQVDRELAARVLWLDGLVMNPDRTRRNPNILLWHDGPWLVDHGAALSFHYDWSAVTEQSPRESGFIEAGHVLSSVAHAADVDAEAAKSISRSVLRGAIEAVPTEILTSAFPDLEPPRVRAAYAAFLWKRLKAPRPFVPSAP
jgi:hypothetical protein